MSAQRIMKKIFLASTGALLSGMLVVAQAPGGMPGESGQPPTPGTEHGYPGAEPRPDTMARPDAGTQPSIADQSFVRHMFESDAVEMQLGQMAQEKSQSSDVKLFGEKMVENRKRLDNQLTELAKRLDVQPPDGPDKEGKEEIARLQSLSGPQFDEEYIRTVEKAHEKDVKSFNQAAQTAKDPSLQRTAQMDAPVIQSHLKVIQQIAQAHDVKAGTNDK